MERETDGIKTEFYVNTTCAPPTVFKFELDTDY